MCTRTTTLLLKQLKVKKASSDMRRLTMAISLGLLHLLLSTCLVFALQKGSKMRRNPALHVYCTEEDNTCKVLPEIAPYSKRPSSCNTSSCSDHSFCFLGACLCHPGYSGSKCDIRLPASKANPWFTSPCPNLHQEFTFDVNLSLSELGGEQADRGSCVSATSTGSCSYLCYGHREYGVAVVPRSLWLAAQRAESALWQQVSRWDSINNDRAEEHWSAFDDFNCLTRITRKGTLGRVMEVGAGPWTQVKGMLFKRPELVIDELTIWEPGAQTYMSTVPSCSYRTNKLEKFEGLGFHDFPLVINSAGGELLDVEGTSSGYDTVISINVVEHVQDAFAYLTGLYSSIRKGGILIMHERYYNSDQEITNGDSFHPVRVKQRVFDMLLDESRFSIVFNNCTASYNGRQGERGYYVIAVKNFFVILCTGEFSTCQ